MRDPRPHLEHLAREANALASAAESTRSTASQRDSTARIGTNVMAELFDAPALRSPTARKIGKAVLETRARESEAELERRYASWFDRTRATLATISTARKNLTTRGNSSELLARLVRTKSGKKVATRASAGARLLESLAGSDPVYNADIPELIRKRNQEKAEERRKSAEASLLDIPEFAPGIDHLKFPNRAAVAARLSGFPYESDIVEGAIETFLGEGKDRFRQSLASCRVALESAAKKVTGEAQWKNALSEVADKATQKLFRNTYELLSAHGAHAGKTTTKAQAEFGIQQSITCIVWLVNHQEEFRKVQAQKSLLSAASAQAHDAPEPLQHPKGDTINGT